jgi:hypothetical protein
MTRLWRPVYQALAGLFVASICGLAQPATTSAEPGTLNYLEGNAYLDGQLVQHSRVGHLSLNPDQTLSTGSNGKAELLLTPGVFFRLGGNSEVRMVTNSLTNTQLELARGEALVDASMLLKDNNIQILQGPASTRLLKNGLYRFDVDTGQIAVFDGKAGVRLDDRTVDIGKGRQVNLSAASLKAEKFDTRQHDDLYAWSDVRSEYAAEASYSEARNITVNNYGGFYGGWLWNPWYSSWAFMPWGGYAYSPFGWGFYSPAYIRYAPIYYAPGSRVAVPVARGRVPHIVAGHGFIRPGFSANVRPMMQPRPNFGMRAAPIMWSMGRQAMRMHR